MQDWQYQFAVIGQEAIEHLEKNPHQGPEAAHRLKLLLSEFKRTSRNKNSNRGAMPNRKDGIIMGETTVSLKDVHGRDIQIPLDLFREIANKVSHRRKVKVSEETYEDDDGFEAAESEEDEEDHEERVKSKLEKRLNRQAWLKVKTKYNMRLQGTRIAWEWVELAGKAMIVGFVIVGTLWVASRLLAPEEIKLLPGDDGGMK